MGQKVTIGGDRLGSGKKMQTELHNYGMSTHNLSTIYRTTAGVGILYPSLVLVGIRDDHFEIKIDQDVRTQPTVAPLFGSFKLQTDVFMCPWRLYQGLLHNNPTELGRFMSQVKLPKLDIRTITKNKDYSTAGAFSNSSLLKYLGMSGLGRADSRLGTNTWNLRRQINAIPALSYYDIFKNYYSNKQEENAYVISGLKSRLEGNVISCKYYMGGTWYNGFVENGKAKLPIDWARAYRDNEAVTIEVTINSNYKHSDEGTLESVTQIFIPSNATQYKQTMATWADGAGLYNVDYNDAGFANKITFSISIEDTGLGNTWTTGSILTEFYIDPYTVTGDEALNLTPFKLANIDQMRYDLLTHCELGSSFIISQTEHNYLPYSTLVLNDSKGETLNKRALNGLCVKTYQSDLFNNWLNAEWIDGENGVAEISKIVTDENGAFTIDQLQFAKKIYNLYNRIAVAGATYYEWQNVVWSESKQTHVESPVYVGGYASEIFFEEVVGTNQAAGEDQDALGQLGGKGRKVGDKGGYIEVDCDEACFILAITSITPRISYTQGNEWYMTELDSIDDVHKPGFDNIGFQDLLGERLAWWDTELNMDTPTPKTRTKVGKVPAWIDYQTNYDRTFGEFADINKAGYMVLTRQYDYDENTYLIKDCTTYIDPAKYNYAFAVTSIDAQNFWLQTNFDIKARRRMSAHLIPVA